MRRLEIELLHLVVDLPRVAMNHVHCFLRDHGQLVVGQVDDLIRAADQRRAIAGDEVLAVADADDQRAAQPGGDDHVGPIAKHHRQAVRAAKLRQRRLHGRHERGVAVASPGRPVRVGRAGPRVELAGDQLGHDLGVGRGLEVVAEARQALLQFAKILNHAVVYNRDHVVAAQMGMGVEIGGRPVGRPTRMPEADAAADRRRLQLRRQVVDPPGRFRNVKRAVVDRHHAARVVAAIFETAEALDQKVRSWLRTDVSDNAAHGGK
jgi:hypothetical protein